MREPATSCTDCGKALLPADILYTPSAAIVCEGCLRPNGPRPAAARPRTRLDRRRSLRRWSLLFAGLALSAFYVSHVARAQLRAARTMATIEAPAAGRAIPRRLAVRGHVAADAITRPLWLVARAPRSCATPVRVPVVADRRGDFDASVNLDALAAGVVRLTVVSVDERANELFEMPPAVRPHGFSAEDCRAGDLPVGTLVLTSIDVTLTAS
ncbi:MAG TPA: hypothetical protein VHU40_02860 [Polyangia bacterium]|nr:hypothetical protein [Polyangia bacterium]